ncbi:MAG TPA: GAF domain-containing sensor histidine kinase [Oculatellaceae cyanobacterium]|jgi:signal transduction histidine kinase
MISPTCVLPTIETERLAAVGRYDILDTPPDGAFDRITNLAARFFNVPISIVSIVDHDRIWFKSHLGLEVKEIGLEPGLCASAILQDEVYIIKDARVDPRTLANPLVAGEFGLQFYAAAPLITSDGFRLGTICVIDYEPRCITEAEKTTLKELAAIVMDELELRLAAKKAVEAEIALRNEVVKSLQREKELNELKSQFVSMISHEFRNPLSSISISAELLEIYGEKFSYEKKQGHLRQVQTSVKKLLHLTNEILTIGKVEAGKLKFNPVPLDLKGFCQSLVAEMQINAGNKYNINFISYGDRENICMDQNLLEHILTNLLSNATKYSPSGGRINFELTYTQQEVIFRIQDSGIGIAPEDQTQLFNNFYRAKNVGKISGTGLGLAIVKNCVDLHGGKITVESDLGVGTTFIVTIPL